MTEPPRSPNSFLDELKRRKVVRVAIVYGAVVFAVIQAADIVFEALAVPAWSMRLLLALAALGFPIVLVLAWVFDITPSGLHRTETTTAADRSRRGGPRWISVRTIVVAGGMLLLGGLAGWLLRPGGGDPAAAAGAAESATDAATRSIAVLPFADLSPQGDQEYLSDGLAEELLNTLAQVPNLQVAARTSAFAFKGEEADVRAIGEQLDVGTVLEGSVRKEGDRLRITAQLIDVETGFHLWSETYERRLESVFAIQEEMAGEIARALRLPLGITAGERLVRGRTTDIEAYELYLQGRQFLNDRAIGRAISHFERVVGRDSSFAPAWGGLAEAFALQPYYARATWDEALPQAEAAARRALALDSTLVSAHTALANILRDRWEWEAAEREYRRALEIDPGNAETVNQYGQYLTMVRDFEGALEQFRRARDLDPLSPHHLVMTGWALWFLRRYEEAASAMNRALTLDPDFVNALHWLERLYVEMGRYEDAERIARRHSQLSVTLVRGAADEAAREEAIRTLQEIDRLAEFGNRPIANTAFEWLLLTWYPLLGLEQETLALVDRLTRSGAGPVSGLWDPGMDLVRDDPRFQEAVSRLELPDRG